MNSTVLQIITLVVGLLGGAGFSKLFTIRAEKKKITGEGAVAEANAAKTYHEMTMDLVKAVQEEANRLRKEINELEGEVSTLRRQVKDMSWQLADKDRKIAELEGRR